MRTLILQKVAEAETVELIGMLLILWLAGVLVLSVVDNLRHRLFVREIMADGSIKKVRRIHGR